MPALTYKMIRTLPGWLAYTDFEIFRAILSSQDELGYSGSVVEIGVHHGKSFIPLCHFSSQSQCYAIDIFDNQEFNLDRSGRGDLAEFRKNLKNFSVDMSRIKIDQRLSSEIKPDDILKTVGPARFFHIDGGHHLDAISSDLTLSVNSSADGVVIAVDDIFRPEWPDVTVGVFQSDILKHHGFVPLAFGFNKLFLCRKNHLESYQTRLIRTPILEAFRSKIYSETDGSVLIYQRYPLPEWGWRNFFSWFLQIYHPILFSRLKSLTSK